MLIVVALVAILLGTSVSLRARAQRLAQRATWHDEQASLFSFSAKLEQIGGRGIPGRDEREEARQLAEKTIADNHTFMAVECRRAMWRPWIWLEKPQPTGRPSSWLGELPATDPPE